KAAKAGELIGVRPGIYLENVDITKDLEIIGLGDRQTVVVETAMDSAVVYVRTPCARLVHLTIRYTGLATNHAILIGSSALVVEDWDLTSATRNGISIGILCELTVRNCRSHHCKGQGIFVSSDRAQRTILEGHEIIENGDAGICL